MLVSYWNRRLPAQLSACRLAQRRRELGSALIVESHEAAVEGGVPQCREQQATVYIKALGTRTWRGTFAASALTNYGRAVGTSLSVEACVRRLT